MPIIPFIILGVAIKLALEESHRRTVQVETDCCCQMKKAGVSDETIHHQMDVWEKGRKKNEAVITAIVKTAEVISPLAKAPPLPTTTIMTRS